LSGPANDDAAAVSIVGERATTVVLVETAERPTKTQKDASTIGTREGLDRREELGYWVVR
jgi:hypothetical protein